MSNYMMKHYQEVISLFFDFNTALPPGSFINPSSVDLSFVLDNSADQTLLIDESLQVGDRDISVKVSGGSPGLNSQIKCVVTTDTGETYVSFARVFVWGEPS